MSEQLITPPQQQPPAKKSKKWVWIVAAVVVLIVIIAVASSTESKKDKSDSTPKQPPTTTLEQKETQVKYTAPASVGESVSIDNLTITVHGFTWSTRGKESFEKPDPGNKYLIVDIECVNNDTKPRMLAQVYQMKVHTPEGYDYKVTLKYFPEPSLTSDEIPPGQKARGYVCFEVPERIGSCSLMVETDMLFGETLEIRLQ
jgi:hypothetical protein